VLSGVTGSESAVSNPSPQSIAPINLNKKTRTTSRLRLQLASSLRNLQTFFHWQYIYTKSSWNTTLWMFRQRREKTTASDLTNGRNQGFLFHNSKCISDVGGKFQVQSQVASLIFGPPYGSLLPERLKVRCKLVWNSASDTQSRRLSSYGILDPQSKRLK
jgi:hypothetical protein